jgi:HD-GYP domain-containing protein (c-di-GMP phosphodiesterase class II)
MLFAAGASYYYLKLRRSRARVERLAAAALESLMNAIDANDPATGAHARHVAAFSLVLAEAAGLDDRTRCSVERVALFHDIGKISEALFDIIHEDRKLSAEERDAIATHPTRGAEVLAPLDSFYPDLIAGVLSHHERWDGTGYPQRLRGRQIPLAARIVAIADTFDAVTFARRYSAEQSSSVGAEVIANGRGTQFDPELADLFLCPPVFECIEDARARLCDPQPEREERRSGQQEEATPDLKFRWRSATPPRPLPGQPSQKSR